MTTIERQAAMEKLEAQAWSAPVAYGRTDSDRQRIVESLRGRAAQLLLEHPDEMEEPYPGAGYCVCKTCQVDVPLMEDAADLIEELNATGEQDARVQTTDAALAWKCAGELDGWASRMRGLAVRLSQEPHSTTPGAPQVREGDPAPGGANCMFHCPEWCDECACQENLNRAAPAEPTVAEVIAWIRARTDNPYWPPVANNIEDALEAMRATRDH